MGKIKQIKTKRGSGLTHPALCAARPDPMHGNLSHKMGSEFSNGVKLITGMLSSDEKFLIEAAELLSKKYGGVDYESDIINFSFTNYYEKEMGKNLLRKFISFKKLINPEDLPGVKIFTNKLEEKFLSSGNKRLINLDPGYVTLGKMLLATTKNQQHRIYLSRGIFAEVTLRYKNKTFCPWEWTYPDYATQEYIKIFNDIRNIYYKQEHGVNTEHRTAQQNTAQQRTQQRTWGQVLTFAI